MKLLRCPVNGLRPVSEFAYGGELRVMPDVDRCTDIEWANYIFHRNGAAGVKKEWWYHVPSGVWFIAERDTARDHVLSTYLYDAAAGPSASLTSSPDAGLAATSDMPRPSAASGSLEDSPP